MRILLVDDEDNLRRLLVHVLKSGGFEVIAFSNSPDALAWSRTNQVDALVTDMTLTEVNGSALAQAVRQHNPELLVVFISGFPLDIEAERAQHPHCSYLEKPFPPRALLRTISDLIEQRRRRSHAWD